jgi:hypothetical protein
MLIPQRRDARRGMAALETVLTAGVFYSMAMMLLIMGCRACNLLYCAIGTLVGWPLL